MTFRLVSEAIRVAKKQTLTSARKHAPGGDITVALRQERNTVILDDLERKSSPRTSQR